jgi:hypothetical protein
MGGPHSDLKPGLIKLPSDLVVRSAEFAVMVVERYATGQSEASRSVSYRDADKNVRLWAEAKMAECIFCIERSINCDVLNWSGEPDHYDLVCNGKRIDVKSTGLNGKYLIWSKAKNHLYHQKEFDYLVFTKVSALGVGGSFGYISKLDFFNRKKIAPHGHQLDVGTWYVDESDLNRFKVSA